MTPQNEGIPQGYTCTFTANEHCFESAEDACASLHCPMAFCHQMRDAATYFARSCVGLSAMLDSWAKNSQLF